MFKLKILSYKKLLGSQSKYLVDVNIGDISHTIIYEIFAFSSVSQALSHVTESISLIFTLLFLFLIDQFSHSNHNFHCAKKC